jgi:hypothetical protein
MVAKRPRARHSKVSTLCAHRRDLALSLSDEAAMRGGARWLVAYAHQSNGLGNKLGGLRGAYAIAHASGRRLRIRWHERQENELLGSADAGDDLLAWEAADGPGIANAPGGAAWDAWGRAEWPTTRDGPFTSSKPTFLIPKSTRRRLVDGNWSTSNWLRPDSELCAPTLHNVHPRNTADLEEAQNFAILARGPAPVVVLRSLTFDVTLPWTRVGQADVAEQARYAYRRLFRPRETFRRHACQHLKHTLNLSFARPWIGLQLRRSQAGVVEDVQTSLGCRLCGPETTWRNESELSDSDEAGILRAVRCARSARRTLCMLRGEDRMCDAPVFVTSSSYRVLRRATELLGNDARYASDPDVVAHGGARNGYLAPLLELAVLSASRVVIGSAGSSFPLEAANLAGATAIVKDFGLYKVAKELRAATVQGACDDPPAWSPEATGSVLLPRGSC